ncbi:MAG: prolipoprotein diacylglyceryl transferase [Candidatus Eiseniibacteriota bacterium]|jgi:phosphatidylglycerol:prolipoprotein diacylglycerol transferase
MWPDLFRIGPLAFHSYGLMLAISFIVGIQLALVEGRRRGIAEDRVGGLALWILVASVVGSRLAYVLTHLDSFSGQRIWGALRVWEGGLTMYGGVVAALVLAYVLARRWRLPVGTVFDTFAPSIALGEGLTRIGCFLNGCCFGKPCALPWAVTFPEQSHAGSVFPGAALHPTQLYLSLAGLATFAVLWWWARHRFETPGRVFFLFLLLASLARFSIDFLRYYDPHGEAVVITGVTLSLTQCLCLLLIAVAVIGLLRRGPKAVAVNAPAPAEDAHG